MAGYPCGALNISTCISLNHKTMIKNYLLTAWRNMMRNKLYTIINVFCLSVGITGALLITLFVSHELSYDTHHEKHDNIYRMEGIYTIAGNRNHLAITAFPLGATLKQEYAGIKNYVRFFIQDEVLVNVGDDKFLEESMAFADSTVFDVFTHEFVYGSADNALNAPNTVVLTRTLAKKFFGDTDPRGKTLQINQENYAVSAIIEDPPSSCHLGLNALMSMSTLDQEMVGTINSELFWNINQNFTYILLHPEASVKDVFSHMDGFHEKYTRPMGSLIGGEIEFTYTPLREVRFSNILMSPETTSPTTLYILSVVAVFLVIIAAVNYTNLATARASVRAREIGIRKAAGATRSQVMSQFLAESLLLAFVALLFSLLLVELLLPGFNLMADKSFSLYHMLRWPFWIYVLVIVAATGLISGLYPAVFVSGLNPSSIFKGMESMGSGSLLLRKSLVVFQFAISILMVTGTLVVQSQLSYLQNKDMGLDVENRFVVSLQSPESRGRIGVLESMLAQHPDVLQTTKSFSVPGRGFNKNAVLVQSGNEMVEATITSNHIDHQFFDALDIEVLEGRSFEQNKRSDVGNSVVINQAAANYFGWREEPLGKLIQWQFGPDGAPQTSLRVIGVVEDHNLLSLHNPIEPVMFLLPEEEQMYHHLIVHYRQHKENEIRSFLESSAMTFDPGSIPNVYTLERGYREQFRAEERMGNIFGVFAIVCIFISFLGLFGLSSFLARQKKREIGVRKVLGSSVGSILQMFYKEFSSLVIIAALLTIPISWFLLQKWLQGVVYQTTITPEPFLLSALLAWGIALITVSYHTFRIAMLNPVDAIRTD